MLCLLILSHRFAAFLIANVISAGVCCSGLLCIPRPVYSQFYCLSDLLLSFVFQNALFVASIVLSAVTSQWFALCLIDC